jgi:hypothetical protein
MRLTISVNPLAQETPPARVPMSERFENMAERDMARGLTSISFARSRGSQRV